MSSIHEWGMAVVAALGWPADFERIVMPDGTVKCRITIERVRVAEEHAATWDEAAAKAMRAADLVVWTKPEDA